MGVAVQSHWFGVGSVVRAASAGLGAVATQAMPQVQHKPRALAMLRDGRSAAEIIAALVEGDPASAYRQFAVVDASGSRGRAHRRVLRRRRPARRAARATSARRT